jgi:hypothetical protein
LRYVEVAGSEVVVARLSDGSIVNLNCRCQAPPIPPGVRCVEVAAGNIHFLARLSNGQVLAWPANEFGNDHGQCDVPPLPPGTSYVEITAGVTHSVARRSDGAVVAWGEKHWTQVPALEPGRTFTQISCASTSRFTVALFTSGGVNWLGDGCAGTVGRTQLDPLATPRIGHTFTTFVNPPPAFGLVFTGFSSTTTPYGRLPIDLSALGMTGCRLRVSPDLIVPVTGTPARADLPIPPDPALTGALFHQQALVLDPGANPAGAVLSDAVTAVIGR